MCLQKKNDFTMMGMRSSKLNESYNNHRTREKAANSELFTESEYEFKIMNTRRHVIYWLRLWTQGSGLDSTPTPPLCNLGKVI